MKISMKKGVVYIDGENEVIDLGKPLYITEAIAVVKNCRFFLRIFKHPFEKR